MVSTLFRFLYFTAWCVLASRGNAADFVQAEGEILKLGPEPIRLRGINFAYDRVASSNPDDAWRIADSSDWGSPVLDWFSEEHFSLAAGIGFNTIRLNLSYRIFEDNADPGNWKASGWELIDTLVAWGKRYDLLLILDMHVAPGGAGIASCMGCGWKTWEDSFFQDRYIALWKAIALRYADEPQIAAYDLLNEPVPTVEAVQWKILAQQVADSIRTVDTNHLFIVEMPVWIFDSLNISPLTAFDTTVLKSFQFEISDSNVMYDFHYYLPTQYTLQDEKGVYGGGYPDSHAVQGTIDGGSMTRTRAYLEHEMAAVLRFWKKNRVPVNFGEWGTAGSAYSDNLSKGGLTYLRDMLAIMESEGINWQFYYIVFLYNAAWNDLLGKNEPVENNVNLIQAFRDYFQGNARAHRSKGRSQMPSEADRKAYFLNGERAWRIHHDYVVFPMQ